MPPSISYSETQKNFEKRKQYINEYIHGMGELYWISKGKAYLDDVALISAEMEKSSRAYVRSSRPVILFQTKSDIEQKMKKDEITVQSEFPNDYKYLQEDDYKSICRYAASKELARDCTALVTEQLEKVNKILPKLSEYITNNVNIDVRSIHTNYTPAEFDKLHYYLYENLDKIDPDFDKKELSNIENLRKLCKIKIRNWMR